MRSQPEGRRKVRESDTDDGDGEIHIRSDGHHTQTHTHTHTEKCTSSNTNSQGPNRTVFCVCVCAACAGVEGAGIAWSGEGKANVSEIRRMESSARLLRLRSRRHRALRRSASPSSPSLVSPLAEPWTPLSRTMWTQDQQSIFASALSVLRQVRVCVCVCFSLFLCFSVSLSVCIFLMDCSLVLFCLPLCSFRRETCSRRCRMVECLGECGWVMDMCSVNQRNELVSRGRWEGMAPRRKQLVVSYVGIRIGLVLGSVYTF